MKSNFIILSFLLLFLGNIPQTNGQCNTTTIPNMSSGCIYGDAVDAFTLNGITTTGNYGCQAASPSYTFFNSPVRTLTIGSTYNFSATTGTSGSYIYTEHFGIWIDYNNNGIYEATDMAYASSSKNTSHSGTITIPNNATAGTNIRMRTRAKYGSSAFSGSNGACLNESYGETEDYYVNLVCPTIGPFSVSIGASPSTTVCAGTSVTFTATPTNGGSAPIYQWKKNGNNVGTNSSTYTDASLASGDAITCVMTPTYTCVGTTTSNTINMTVNSVVPSVSINQNPTGTVCGNASVTFTATPTNGGASPTYQWKKNGINVGAGGATYTNNSWTNGDQVSVVMTSNATCANPASPTSNTITMSVNPVLTPSVSIAANPGTIICSGTSVTFTPTPTNGGTTPTYQWKVNGSTITNGNSYTYTPANGDQVTTVMTSNYVCPGANPVTSNTLTITYATPVTPSVTITKNPNGAICPGVAVSFFANPTNGGSSPSYQWKLNGNVVGGNSPAYSNPGNLSNNDVVSVIMTPSICVSPTTATNSTTVTVNTTTTPSVSITSNATSPMCGGTSVTFNATASNAGSSPVYQWKRNGTNVGTNSSVYTTTALANGDMVTCVVTSNAICPSPAQATSNAITMNVTSTLTPSVAITANPAATSCQGVAVQFTAVPYGPGSNPSFQWKIDGNNVGTNSNSYTDPGLMSGGTHTISCVMTSNYSCISGSNTATGTLSRTVNPTLVPSVTISSPAAPSGNVCAGVSVTFTATTVNPGTTPTYQWKKNGQNVGTNSPSYAAGTTLATGDVITCQLTSNALCVAPAIVTSNAVNIIVWPNLTTSVSVTSDAPSNSGCLSLPVTFTANAVNAGPTPTYQWKKNNVNVGSNSSSYTDATLVTGDKIACVVNPSVPCATPTAATSNTITMTMNPIIPTTINITVTPDSVACEGSPMVFNASFTNPGNNPIYKWYLNGNAIPGAAQTVYSSNALADGDVVACEMISSLTCAFPVMSNGITAEITPTTVPSVEIGGYPDVTGIMFYSTVTNAGATPTYQWRKNGVDVAGATSPTFHSLNHQPTDKIALFVHSSAPCSNPEYVVSKSLQPIQVTAIGNISGIVSDLRLFPNPNDGRFKLSGTVQKTGGEAAIEVLNAVGQTVYKQSVKLNSHDLDMNIDLGGRAVSGMYMVRITIDGNTESLRFVLR